MTTSTSFAQVANNLLNVLQGYTNSIRLLLVMFLTLTVSATAWGADVSVTWPKTTALSTTATNVDGDANVTIKVSEANAYTNPLRFYAGKTTTIEVAEGYQLKSVAYEASSTGNYVTYAQNATVSPDVTPSVNGKIITWDLSGSNTKTFTFKPSTQTRCNSITITYTATAASCDKKVTVNKGTPSNGSFSISKTGTYETCAAPLVITLSNITPFAGYQFSEITQSGINSGVIIDRANKTVTYTKNTSGTSTINVTFTALPTYTVKWMVNGVDYNVGDPTTQVYDGGKVTKLPTAPDPANNCGEVFAGWTTTPIDGTTNTKPSVLFTTAANSPTITGDVTFYAVFADYEQ